jgi:hypothetical protein
MAYYVRTNVSLKLGQNEGYNEIMDRLIPVMAAGASCSVCSR